jgi:hypothetical protein
MLHLTMTHESGGGSEGKYRIYRTGLVAGSSDHNNDGKGQSHGITIDAIADDGVTVTIGVSDSQGEQATKQFLVPYDREITVVISSNTTAIARLESKD